MEKEFNQSKYIQKYMADNYHRLQILVRKDSGLKERIQAAAAKRKMPLSEFVLYCVAPYLEADAAESSTKSLPVQYLDDQPVVMIDGKPVKLDFGA